jgi:hypothetical protein
MRHALRHAAMLALGHVSLLGIITHTRSGALQSDSGVMRNAATALNGEVLAPMRKAEAEITLGVVAARNGDIDQALAFGRDALLRRNCLSGRFRY